MRFGRFFNLTKRDKGLTLEPIAEMFNLLNSNAVTSQVTTVGSKYGTPSAILEGRLLRLGFQMHF
jgi:hypothetical protein